MEVYYFSPTGGTKKVSSIFADAMEKEVIWHDLGSKEPMMEKPEGEMTVVASPVFGGRIPSVVREKIEKFSGTGKKAVTIAVYGNRAYEDALLEMNDILTKCGFTVIASGAFVAQHSMAPEIGAGRPDGEDEKAIQTRDEYAGCTNFPTILYEVWKMRNCLSDKRYFSCRWSSDYGYREMYSLHGMHPYLYGTGEN